MGDIIKRLPVSARENGPTEELAVYFDNGATRTMIKRSVVERLGLARVDLPQPWQFRGMGDGHFQASQLAVVGIVLLDVWCGQPAFVIDDDHLDPGEDLLVGQDFLQAYRIKLDPADHDIIADRNALLRERLVR